MSLFQDLEFDNSCNFCELPCLLCARSFEVTMDSDVLWVCKNDFCSCRKHSSVPALLPQPDILKFIWTPKVTKVHDFLFWHHPSLLTSTARSHLSLHLCAWSQIECNPIKASSYDKLFGPSDAMLQNLPQELIILIVMAKMKANDFPSAQLGLHYLQNSWKSPKDAFWRMRKEFKLNKSREVRMLFFPWKKILKTHER